MKRRNKLAALAVLVAAALASSGNVFVRWKAGSDSARALEAMGGKAIYRASVAVNGGKGNLAIFGFDAGFSSVVRDVAKAFGTQNSDANGATMSLLSVTTDVSVTRMLVLSLDRKDQTIVFALEQSPGEAETSAKAAVQPLPAGIPDYPGSDPLFHARDDEAAVELAVYGANAAANAVTSFYDSSLVGLGWTSLLPRGAGGSLVACQKGMDLCWVFVTPQPVSGKGTITVLHKRLQMK